MTRAAAGSTTALGADCAGSRSTRSRSAARSKKPNANRPRSIRWGPGDLAAIQRATVGYGRSHAPGVRIPVPSCAMAILGTILGAIGKLLNRLVNAALGWAGLLLFGKLPPLKQNVLLMVTLGSLGWIVVIIAVIVPDFGTWMLAFVPVPDFIPDWVVRLVMLALAIAIPIAIGVALIWLTPAHRRRKGAGMVVDVLRGFPFAAAMALTVVVLAVVATVRKVRSLIKRWDEQHVVVVAQPGRYEDLVRDVEDALDQADVPVDRKPAPVVLAMPAKILGWIAGTGLADLVPDRRRLVREESRRPRSSLGHPGVGNEAGGRPRACSHRHPPCLESRVPDDEPRCAEGRGPDGAGAKRAGGPSAAALREIDRRLETLVIPYEEWETLYRMRLQLVAGGGQRGARHRGTGQSHGAAGNRSRSARTTRWSIGSRRALATAGRGRRQVVGRRGGRDGPARRRRATDHRRHALPQGPPATEWRVLAPHCGPVAASPVRPAGCASGPR